jgi:hypothetical protein
MLKALGSTSIAAASGLALTGSASANVPCYDVDIDDIPNHFVSLYKGAADRWGLAWEFLAAIGRIETNHGQCCSGCAVSSAGARGPMQFIDSTWNRWGYDANNNGDVDRCEPADAIYSAARYLVNIGAPQDYHEAAGNYYGCCCDNYCDAAICIMNQYQNQSGGDDGGGGGGDGGSGGPNVIRFKGHKDSSYAFHTTGDINRMNAEPHDENLHISGNDHDEIDGWIGAGNWDEFNYAGMLAWIDTPSLYIDIDDDVIRFKGNSGAGRSDYTFHTTGDIDKLASADGNDDNQYIKGNDHDEIKGTVFAGNKDAFQFEDKLAWISTPDLYIDIDQA